MAARAGLRRDDVVDEAIAMIDEGTASADVTLGALARRLGIRPQSLYAHVDGSGGLSCAIAAAGLQALAGDVTAAGIGANGVEAVTRIVRAHLAFARARPGLYEAAIHPPGDDPDLLAAIDSVGAPLERVLTTTGMTAEERVHWTRLFLASVYGYVVLRHTGRFSLPFDPDETESQLVEMLIARLPSS